MAICPKDMKPCCDDLCYGGGCLALGGYPMLHECSMCGQLVDEENGGECACCDDDEYEHMFDDPGMASAT